jgi:hypothetical protein
LLYSRIFPTGEEALAWAEEERKELIEQAWVEQDTRRDVR